MINRPTLIEFEFKQQVEEVGAEIELRTQNSRRISTEGLSNLTMSESAVERSREILKTAQRYLETEGDHHYFNTYKSIKFIHQICPQR